MPRLLWIIAALLIAAVAGCARKQAPAPVRSSPDNTASRVSTENSQPTSSAPSSSVPSSSAPSSSAPPVAAAPPGSLRDVLGRYLESDGAGGWRPNELAATELEKLAPKAADLLALLADPQAEIRRGAAFALLGSFDPAQPEQVAAFTGLLADGDRTIRGIGLSAVKEMRNADQVAALPKLADMLVASREDKADNRASVARLFGALKSAAAPSLPPLIVAARSDPDAKVRAACLAAIAQIVPPAEAVAPLIAGLGDSEAAVKVVAAAQLRRLGKAAAPAAKDLAAALRDADQRVRENSTEALIMIGAPAVEPLTGVLGGENNEARKYALAALAKIGPPAKSALPAIEKCLKEGDAAVGQLAAQALKQIGPP